MRIRFQEVKAYGMKSVKCGCGQRVRRQRTFWQTLNPWNTAATGLPKTPDEIYAELIVKRDAWKAEAETCNRCASLEDT